MTPKAIEYFKSLSTAERRGICDKVGIDYMWLRNMIYSNRSCSVKVALLIERVTQGAVRAEDLRPDLNWQLINPKEFDR